MFQKCALCSGSIAIFGEKFFGNVGNKVGSFEITEKRPLCEQCYSIRYDNRNDDEVLVISRLIQEKNYLEARNRLKSIYNAKRPDHNYNAANIFMNLEQFEKALKFYDKAIFLNTHYTKAWYRKGALLILQKNPENAIKCFENVISLDPLNKLGWTFPAQFQRMICLIFIHNTAVLEGRPSNLSPTINELLLYFYPRLSEISKFHDNFNQLNKLIENQQYEKWIENYVDFCNENYIPVLDEIEPDIVLELVGPEGEMIRYFNVDEKRENK